MRQLDPARDAHIPDPDGIIARRIRKDAVSRTRSGRERRRVLVGGVAVALVVFAGTAAAVLLNTGDAPNPVQSLCYSGSTLSSDAVGTTVGTTANISDCYRLWQDGTFANNGVVPGLTACVLNGGGLAVLPCDDELCASLGLATSTQATSIDPVIELQNQLQTLVPLGVCVPFDETVASMRNVVDSLDLPGWKLSVRDQPTADRPCASFSLEGDSMTVVVVPIPAPS